VRGIRLLVVTRGIRLLSQGYLRVSRTMRDEFNLSSESSFENYISFTHSAFY